MRTRVQSAALTISLLAAACADHAHDDAGSEDVRLVAIDAMDAASDTPDVMPVDPCGPAVCLPQELCGASNDGGIPNGNGVDDNCNGTVDEGCTCTFGAMQACWPGPPDRRNTGVCRDGRSTCTELNIWSDCRDAVLPSAEVCDGLDNDCNGSIDEGLTDCATSIACPTVATGRPLQDYTVDGQTIDPTATGFAWAFECPTDISPCPSPDTTSDAMFTVHPVQAGRYTVRLTVTRADGSTNTCRYPLYVASDGIRLELDWDTKGGIASAGVDMDLHLVPQDRSRAASAQWFTNDDCYYATCAAPGGVVNWRTSATDTRFAPNTDTAECEGAPGQYGESWRASGRCWNPRLDTDDRTCDPSVTDPRDRRYCFVENINVDTIPGDVTFRAMVNYFRDEGSCTDDDPRNDVTHPRVTIYCGGVGRTVVGELDTGLVSMACADNRAIGSTNWSWIAADIHAGDATCGGSQCKVDVLLARRGVHPLCSMVAATDDICQDSVGHVFVRNAGGRPINVEFPSP